MDTPLPPAAGSPATPAVRVMLISVWCRAGEPWFARVVLPDAQVHEFTSPFELARFLGQAQLRQPDAAGRRRGLR